MKHRDKVFWDANHEQKLVVTVLLLDFRQ